jgi:hypothetical protein
MAHGESSASAYRRPDITDSGIDFKEGETVTGIEIVFGPR